MAQHLPFPLRGFAAPNSDAEPKDEAERAPDFHEVANKKECGARVLHVFIVFPFVGAAEPGVQLLWFLLLLQHFQCAGLTT